MKLEPCPFCKSKVYTGKHIHYEGKYIVRCGSDGKICPFFPSSGPINRNELKEAIKAWNRRAN